MTRTQEFVENLKQAPRHIRESALRTGKPPETDRERSQSTFHNLFLHMQSVRTDRRSLRFAYTFGLGLILTASFVVLTITGILLMVYYKPGVELAYNSVKDIHFVVPAGRFIRNIHRWSAHLMVLAVFLHMARVFYTGSYKRPREFNWVIGLALMAVVRGRTPAVGRAPEASVPSWPNLLWAEMAAFMFTIAVTLALSYFFDAPLKEMANPAIPENPAKAPWYFLGLQELVSYSAFMGGVGIPGIVLIGLGMIP